MLSGKGDINQNKIQAFFCLIYSKMVANDFFARTSSILGYKFAYFRLTFMIKDKQFPDMTSSGTRLVSKFNFNWTVSINIQFTHSHTFPKLCQLLNHTMCQINYLKIICSNNY